jgi:hypothetical protein
MSWRLARARLIWFGWIESGVWALKRATNGRPPGLKRETWATRRFWLGQSFDLRFRQSFDLGCDKVFRFVGIKVARVWVLAEFCL